MVLGGLALGIIAVFLPPLAVAIRAGCGVQLLVNILLTCLAWLPGVLHAWFVILEYPNARQRHREMTVVREYKRPSHEHRRSRSKSMDSRRSTPRTSYEPIYRAGPHQTAHATSYAPPPVDPYYRQQTGYAPAPKPRY